jgi:hypothetical protein
MYSLLHLQELNFLHITLFFSFRHFHDVMYMSELQLFGTIGAKN